MDTYLSLVASRIYRLSVFVWNVQRLCTVNEHRVASRIGTGIFYWIDSFFPISFRLILMYSGILLNRFSRKKRILHTRNCYASMLRVNGIICWAPARVCVVHLHVPICVLHNIIFKCLFVDLKAWWFCHVRCCAAIAMSMSTIDFLCVYTWLHSVRRRRRRLY